MKLKTIILKNFRAYMQETRIDVEDLTAFIGKNDVGKSSILEALEIFFNSELVSCEHSDPCVFGDSKDVLIGCAFTDLPDQVVLDETATTTLQNEFLLNAGGFLEIHKLFDCSGRSVRESVFAYALHPTAESVKDLLQLKNTELKKKVKELKIPEEEVDLRSNPSMRQGIYRAAGDLSRQSIRVPLEEQDGKKVWEALKKELPVYAFFRADRPSRDDDAEVQDPMKVAVTAALKELESELQGIKDAVQEKATDVAKRTLDKLREIDPALAGELSPDFKAEPKWDTLFKLSLTGDNQIPINKRGSGARRLILLSFFRAEAERKRETGQAPGIIYAIEEPETSQHPSNQKMIVEALAELAKQEGCQVLITTHVPGLASLLPVSSLRYVRLREDKCAEVSAGGEALYDLIATELGVLADSRVQVLVCVEGPHDVECLKHLSRTLHERHNAVPDLSAEPRLAFFPLGGSTLRQWVEKRYLKGLHKPEIHLYDRGNENPPRHQGSCDAVNSQDNCFAGLTGKNELENYLHPDAIREALNVEAQFGDDEDVPELVARVTHERANPHVPWGQLSDAKRRKKVSQAKVGLNERAAARMTHQRLGERDPNGDIENWLQRIGQHLA